jgi:hypothetical protein
VAIGLSGRTYEKARAVLDAAKAAPKRFGALAAEMDRTGRVDRAYKQPRKQQEQDRLIAEAATVELPDGVDLRIGDFGEVLADIPDASEDPIFTDPPRRGGVPAPLRRLGRAGGPRPEARRKPLLLPRTPRPTSHPRPHVPPPAVLVDDLRSRRPSSARLPGTPILVEWRPLLWFVKGEHPTDEGSRLSDLVELDRYRGRSKAPGWHEREIPATHCIQRLTRPDQVVLDPCINDGAALMSALHLKRIGIGVAPDPDRAAMAKARLGSLLSALKRARPPWRDGRRPQALLITPHS